MFNLLDYVNPEIPGLFVLILIFLMAFLPPVLSFFKDVFLEAYKSRLNRRADKHNRTSIAVKALDPLVLEAYAAVFNYVKERGSGVTLPQVGELLNNGLKAWRLDLSVGYCDLVRELRRELLVIVDAFWEGKSSQLTPDSRMRAIREACQEGRKALTDKIEPLVRKIEEEGRRLTDSP